MKTRVSYCTHAHCFCKRLVVCIYSKVRSKMNKSSLDVKIESCFLPPYVYASPPYVTLHGRTVHSVAGCSTPHSSPPACETPTPSNSTGRRVSSFKLVEMQKHMCMKFGGAFVKLDRSRIHEVSSIFRIVPASILQGLNLGG